MNLKIFFAHSPSSNFKAILKRLDTSFVALLKKSAILSLWIRSKVFKKRLCENFDFSHFVEFLLLLKLDL